MLDHLKLTVMGMQDRGAGFHPITAVQVANTTDLAIRCLVDVAADDSGITALIANARNRCLKVTHIAYRLLDRILHPF